MKIVGLTVAAVMMMTSVGVVSPAAARDQHRHGWHKRTKVCHMVRRHHHRERVCSWR